MAFECSNERYEGIWHREWKALTNKNETFLSSFRRISLQEMGIILLEYFSEQPDISFDKSYL